MFKKLLSFILVLSICIACFSSVAFADTDIVMQAGGYDEPEIEQIQEGANANKETGTPDVLEDESEEPEPVVSEETEESEEVITDAEAEVSEESEGNELELTENKEPELAESDDLDATETVDLKEITENEEHNDFELEEAEAAQDIQEGKEETSDNPKNEDAEVSEKETIDEAETEEKEITEETQKEAIETLENIENKENESNGKTGKESSEEPNMQNPEDELIPEISDRIINFFAVYENEREGLKQYIDFFRGDSATVSYNYAFLDGPISVIDTTDRFISFAHNYSANLAEKETFIALYNTFVEEVDAETEIDIVFSCSDDDTLFFKQADGSQVELTAVESYGADGKKIARIKLSETDYDSIAYFSIPYCRVEVLKLVGRTSDTDIIIHSVTITGAPNSYAVVRSMKEDCVFDVPILGVGVVPNNDGNIALNYVLEDDGSVSINATSNAHVYVLDGHELTVSVIATDLQGFIFEDFIPTENPQTSIDRALKEAEDEKKDNDKADDPNATTEGAIELNTEATTDSAIEVASDAAIENIPDATPVEMAETVDSNASISEAQAIEEIFEENTSAESIDVIEEPEEESPAEEKKEEKIQAEEQQEEASQPETQTQETEPEPEIPSSDDIPEDTNVVPEEVPADASLIPAETPIENETISTSEVSSAIEGATLIVELGTIETAPQYTDASVI